MNALDRYLRSVKHFLPGAQQDDILRELEETLRSEMKELEAELGRPLNEADREAVLSRHGSPITVAGRHRRHERRLAIGIELIGPDLFPHYLKWLVIPIGITVLLFAVALFAGRRPTLSQFVFPVSIQFACVTLIFIVLQVWQNRYGVLDHWKASSLPEAELIRRYLHAVRFWLPRAQRDDIVAELAENLRSEIEERETALGRKLDEAELVAILKAHGEPLKVASNYLPPRCLIGPALFPIYRFVVRLVVLGILSPIYVLIVGPLVVKTAANPGLAGIQALWSLLMSALFSLGVITLVFAIIEFRSPRTSSDWDPRRLPPAPPATHADDLEPMSWYRATTGVFVSALFALTWVYLAQPQMAADFEGVHIRLAPVWRTLFWPILAVLLSGAVTGLAGLLRPNAARLHAAIRLVADALTLIVLGFLLGAHSWIEIAAPGRPPTAIESSDKWTNLGLWISLMIVGVIVLAEGVRDARRLFRRKRVPLHSLAGLIFLLVVCAPARAQSSPSSDDQARTILTGRVPVEQLVVSARRNCLRP